MILKSEISPHYGEFEELHRFVNNLPVQFSTTGTELFANRRNVLKCFEVKSEHPVLEKVVVKRFHARHIFQTLAYSTLTVSKAQRAFHNGLMLRQCELSTPEPLAYVEEKCGGMLRYCYYLTAFTDAKSVRKALDVDFNKLMARCFAQFIARLHQHGMVHHDLNFDNVLYTKKATDDYEISVIDINRLTYKDPKQLTLTDCKDDFVRWTDRKDLLRYVIEEYAKAREFDPQSTLNEVMHLKAIHDRNWRRRKKFTRKFKNL